MFPDQLPLFINGKFVTSQTTAWQDVIDPTTQKTLSSVPMATKDEVELAITGAQEAFHSWSETPVPERARLMLRYQDLLKKHQDEIAEIICKDLGKTIEDAKGDVWRGIEVVEHASSIATLMMGETVENVARRIDTYSYTQPLGVCAGITPFNFPAMIPLWMFPLANACGNTFILKPSEQVPLTAIRLMELYQEAGAPDGICQLVHGGKEQVDQILEHPLVRAISFVGSIPVGEHIYTHGTKHLKRVQCMTGAKNHAVIMPDANRSQTINALVGAAFGACGQRCMALSVAIMVGPTRDWVDDIAAAAQKIRPGQWQQSDAAFGPQVSPQALAKVERLIDNAYKEGATCLLDGRNVEVPGFPDGNWIGPTLFTDVKTDMEIYQQEVFGPVLCVINVDTLDEAIELINNDFRGNGTSIFTDSGSAARKFQHEILAGQVGINIPIPVPLPFFSFTGWRGSFLGDLHAYGKQAVRFYTETKTITARWFESDIPTGTTTDPNMSIQLR